MALDVLKGVSCPDHRSTLIDLNQQGWDIERTSNGHLKLTHAKAAKPVFSGTTVSDFRARKNLISQCRNAIKLSRGTRSQAAEMAPMNEADARKVLISHKTAKKVKKRRVAFDRYNPCSVDQGCSAEMSRMKKTHMRSGTSIPASAVPYRPSQAQHMKQSALEKAEAVFAKNPSQNGSAPLQSSTGLPAQDDAGNILPVGTAANEIQASAPEVDARRPAPTKPKNAAVKDAPHTTDQNSMTEDNTLEITTINRKNAQKATPAKSRKAGKRTARDDVPKVTSSVAKKQNVNLTHISAEVMELARKIASGDFKQVLITPEMVGATLLFNGQMMIAENCATIQPEAIDPRACEVAEQPAAAVVTVPDVDMQGTEKLDRINAKLVAAVKDFAPEAVTQKDLSELLCEELGYKSVASALASISSRLTRLCNAGIVVEEKKGRLRAFRLAM